MRTARRYLAREIYRSSFVVLVALLGLFTFFQLVDELDNVGDRLTLAALFYMQALAMPTRLYDLLPIGLLIGAILGMMKLRWLVEQGDGTSHYTDHGVIAIDTAVPIIGARK